MLQSRGTGSTLTDGDPPPGHHPLESTADLLELVRRGDRAARERLASRYLQLLRPFAHGRLPAQARALLDTDDLVQVTLVRALDQVQRFESRREGAFLGYLRRILLNQIRDEVRRIRRRPGRAELGEDLPALGPTPLEDAIGRETVERYEAALDRLTDEQREVVVMRLELGLSYQQIVDALGRGSPDAVRMMVSRALVRMSELMRDTGRSYAR